MSKYTNYFYPYTSISQKENSLTRAFCSLVRFIPSVAQGFYSMLHEKSKDGLPHPSVLSTLMYNVEMQKRNLPKSSIYVSVLITKDYTPLDIEIVPSTRTAQYDGIFTIDDVTFFIENKPYNDIGESQLCPSEKDIDTEDNCILHKNYINLTWSEIIKWLNRLSESSHISHSEELLIDDFFSFVDNDFVNLNPFDKLHLCKSEHLVQRRLKNILMDIASEPESVGWHSKWANALPTPSYNFIGKVGIPLHNYDEENYRFHVTLIMADTIGQARPFYHKDYNIVDMLNLNLDGWKVGANFHIGFMEANIVFFETDERQREAYIHYWQKNRIPQINAYPNESNVFNALNDYLDQLASLNLIGYDSGKKEEVYKAFGGDIVRKKASIRPGFYMQKILYKKDAELLDKENKLTAVIKKEIVYVFHKLTGEYPDFIKKDGYEGWN